MYTFNNQESQKKSVGYTKTKLGLDTKFERGISANTFSALEGRPKSHLAARSPLCFLPLLALPASARAPRLPRAYSPRLARACAPARAAAVAC
jgi:hypothetical protein